MHSMRQQYQVRLMIIVGLYGGYTKNQREQALIPAKRFLCELTAWYHCCVHGQLKVVLYAGH